MSDAKIVVGQGGPSRMVSEPVPVLVWRVLQALGLIFLAVGLFDLALVWYPARFGSPEFEFASVGASLNAMPVATMGIGLVLASSAALGSRALAWVALVAAVAGSVLVVAGSALFALSLPLALKADVEPVLMVGIKKQAAKTGFQALVYLIGYIALARWALASARK